MAERKQRDTKKASIQSKPSRSNQDDRGKAVVDDDHDESADHLSTDHIQCINLQRELVCKTLHCSPSASRVRRSTFANSPAAAAVIDQLRAVFPNTDKQILEKALEVNGNDLDSAIKSLNELCFGYVDGNSGSVALPNAGGGVKTNSAVEKKTGGGRKKPLALKKRDDEEKESIKNKTGGGKALRSNVIPDVGGVSKNIICSKNKRGRKAKKRVQEKKSTSLVVPECDEEYGFLHDHDKCIRSVFRSDDDLSDLYELIGYPPLSPS
ncbi:hypothetical protein OROHE_002017 [Orobanche hederae]